MRIEKLILKNYLGIYLGMKVDKIELDFSMNQKRTILLLGSNGSGKSTIMSTLHPFANTFDENRDSFIIQDKDGYKEIHISNDNDYYVIKHFYGKKNNSFITKNNVELNESGGVRTFLEVIKNELNITPDHFKLIKIGSASSNFIDMTSSTRKSYIGKFTPNIEEFLTHYKTINDKFSITTKSIKFIVDEISKLPEEESIDNSISINEKTLVSNRKSLKKLESDVLKLENELASIDEKLADYDDTKDLDTINHRIFAINDEINNINESIENIIASLSESELESIEFINLYNYIIEKVHDEPIVINLNQDKTFKEILSKFKDEFDLIKSEIKNLQFAIQSTTVKLKQNEASLNSVDRINTDDLNAELAKNEQNLLNQLENIIKYSTEYKLVDEYNLLDTYLLSLSIDEVNDIINEISKVEVNLSTFIEKLNNASLNSIFSNEDFVEFITVELKLDKKIVKTRNDLILFLANTYDIDKLNDLSDRISLDLETLEKDLSAQKKTLKIASEKVVEVSATQKVAGLCNSSKCPVFKIKQGFEETTSLVDSTKENIEQLHLSITELETFKDNLSVIISIFKTFKNFKEYLVKRSSYENLLSKFMTESLDKLITFDYQTNKLIKFNSINSLLSSIRLKINIQNSIDNIKSKLSDYENISKYTVNLETQIHDDKRSINDLKIKLDKLNKYYIDLNSINTHIINLLEYIDKLFDFKSKQSILNKEYKDLRNYIEANKAFIERKTTLVSEIQRIKDEITSLEDSVVLIDNELNKFKLQKLRIDEFKERHANLIKDRNILQILKEVLDIKTGIPLYIIGSYLGSIKENTNKLLKMAFNQGFEIDFNISDSEFTIPVYRNGFPYNKDILSCSQGEVALLKTSISLGIINQVLKQTETKYNIVYLDEIDSELDTDKRYAFLDILNNQLDALNCEQNFIITHNEAFQSSEIGLILLKGSNIDVNDEAFMFNKTLIADFR